MQKPMPQPIMRTIFKGRVKWAFLVIVPFSVLFAETWFNTETIRMDYQVFEITKECKALAEELDGLKIEQARLENMDRMEVEAPDLGLVAPGPNQIKEIYCQETKPHVQDKPKLGYELAQLYE